MLKRVLFFLALLVVPFSVQAAPQGQEPVVIASLLPFTGYKEGAIMAQNAVNLAQSEINAQGGILGRPLKILFRDTHADPVQTLKQAEYLLQKENIHLFTGTQFDHTGLAMNDFAQKNKVFFFRETGTTPRFGWDLGNRYAWRGGDTNTWYMAKALAQEAAKNPAKRWAIFAPNYEYGRSVSDLFKTFLTKERPDVSFVYEVYPETYKFNALQSLHAAAHKKADAYFTLLFGRDHAELVRQGQKIKAFDGKFVMCGMCGFGAELDTTGKETPVGWVSPGYPAKDIDLPTHKAFVAAFEKAYHETPYVEAFLSYQMPFIMKQLIERAQSTDPEKIIEANKGKSVQTLLGPKSFNPFTNELNEGFWIGQTGFQDGHPALLDWHYIDVDPMYPGDAFVKNMRAQNSERK